MANVIAIQDVGVLVFHVQAFSRRLAIVDFPEPESPVNHKQRAR